MSTDTISDYSQLDIAVTERNITLSRDGESVFVLNPGLEEGAHTVLLRVGERVSFYRVVQCGDLHAANFDDMMRAVAARIEGGLFYMSGNCLVKNRKNRFKVPCRAVMVGSNQIALRDTRLLFTQVYVKDLGTVNLDDTGDTLQVYSQLNDLI